MAKSVEVIQLIAGLGNPGTEYANTRHNAGHWLIDALAHQLGVQLKSNRSLLGGTAIANIAGAPVRLFKPSTQVNISGQPIGAACRYYRIPSSAMLVVHDDIDLPSGVVRLKFDGGHGGHNGLRDLFQHVGRDFWRLRLGVGHPGRASEVVSYVLRPLKEAERAEIEPGLQAGLSHIPALARGEFEGVMNELHN